MARAVALIKDTFPCTVEIEDPASERRAAS
jgi:hypothetical protein